MPTVSFYTLGCRSNQYETDRMAKTAACLGFELVPYPAKADIYVINTCTVTGNSDKKSRHTIRHAKKLNPNAKVIVTGCYVEADHFNLKCADVVLGNKDKFNIANHLTPSRLSSGHPSPRSGEGNESAEGGERGEACPSPRVRANLMVEDGCENFCSYCIVPYVRGKVRSRPMDEILAEAKEMVKDGVKEIVLTGINLGEYNLTPSRLSSGHPSPLCGEGNESPACGGGERGEDLSSLINELSNIDGLLRIRLSSIEPQYVTDELIKTVRDNPKVCKHLHIPMQSGDDKVLKAMNRTYTAEKYRDMVQGIRDKIKDVAITTDIIVGFPGEDDKAFKNTCKLVNALQFSRIHIFSYSDRPGTAAEKMKDKVDPKTIASRFSVLNKLREKYMLNFHRSFKGKPMDVLIESIDKKTSLSEGLTSNYIRVFLDGQAKAAAGKIVKAKFKRSDGENVIASPVV